MREKAKQIMDLLASNQTIRDEREKARKLRDKVRPPSRRHCLIVSKPRNSHRPPAFALDPAVRRAEERQQRRPVGGISSGGRYGECERRAAHATKPS